MPRNQSTAAKRARRDARTTKHTEVLRAQHVLAVPPIPPGALAAANADPAAGYDQDDWSSEATTAFRAAGRVRYWEERRAGRPVRLWETDIAVRAAASSLDEARWLLHVGYLHRPVFRVPDLGADSLDREQPVTRVPDEEIGGDERAGLIASYPAPTGVMVTELARQ